MVRVSDHVIETMGFKNYPDGLTIEAKYHCIKILQVDGLAWTNRRSRFRRLQVEGCEVRISIGNSLNRMCENVLGDSFTDDEEKWVSEKSCSPPYIMLFFSLDEFSQQTTHWYFENNGEIHTYKSFDGEKSKIKELEARLAPRVTAALSCALASGSTEPIAVRLIDSTYFGMTRDGRAVHDIRLSMSADLSVNRIVSSRQITRYLNQIENIAQSLDSQASEFFFDATIEKDNLKKFLFFFLFIERQTHYTFKLAIGEAKPKILAVSGWGKSIARLSYFREIEKLSNLSDRFIWCANFVWGRVSDIEINQFLHLKKVRDDMAHGNARRLEKSDISSVEMLAKKLYSL